MLSPDCKDTCKCGITRVSDTRISISAASASIESIDDKGNRFKSGTSFKICSSKTEVFVQRQNQHPDARSTPEHHLIVAAVHQSFPLPPASAIGTERELPRAKRNNAERATMITTRLHLQESPCSRRELVNHPRPVFFDLHDVRDIDTRTVRSLSAMKAAKFFLIALYPRRLRMAAIISASVCAAQPVTIISASGFSLRAFRVACRARRVASAVTAQVLKMMALSSPAFTACPRHDF